MPRKFKFCVHCRRTITEQEIARWAFVQTKDGLLCATCAQQLDEEGPSGSEASPETGTALAGPPAVRAEPPAQPEPPPASEPVKVRTPEKPPDPAPAPSADAPEETGAERPADLLESIHRHLAAIHRTLVFEKSSTWTVLATVAQCLAAGVLMLAVFNWTNKPEDLLLVALTFQVMALTFFVRGK